MYAQVEKSKENRSQSVANTFSPKKAGGKSTFQFVDNRPEAIVQRKLQDMVNNSPQAKQAAQLQEIADNYSAQQRHPTQNTENNTGLPEKLKSGIENLSGYSMDDVKVHYNSAKPGKLQAHAYTQGTNIHIASGQEKHLPHEAWHAVQQKQGRVNPTIHKKGLQINVNDDANLEKEADLMGNKALQMKGGVVSLKTSSPSQSNIIQRMTGFEIETFAPIYQPMKDTEEYVPEGKRKGWTKAIGDFLFGGVLYGHTYAADPTGFYTVSADHNNKIHGPHMRLVYLLIMAGLLKQEIPFRGMSIAEFIGKPFEETGSGREEHFQQSIDITKQEVKKVIDIQREGQTQDFPYGNGVLTGVPKEDIINWVKQNTTKLEAVKVIVEELYNISNDSSLHLQKTTGVLPKDIPDLYREAQDKLQSQTNKYSLAMSKAMKVSTMLAYQSISSVKIHPLIKQHQKTITGFLTYLATHLIADNLSAIGLVPSNSTDKNLFPFFPKVPLSTALQAMPKDILKEEHVPFWNELIENLIKKSFKYNVQYWNDQLNLKRNDGYETNIFKDRISLYPRLAMKSKAKKILLSLVSKEHPETHIGIEKNLPGLDEPDKITAEITGQSAIPVEDRVLDKKYKAITANNLDEVLKEEFTSSASRMGKHQQVDIEDSHKLIGLDRSSVSAINPVVATGRYRDLQKLHQKVSEDLKDVEENIRNNNALKEEYLKSLKEFEAMRPEEISKKTEALEQKKEEKEEEEEKLSKVIEEQKKPLEAQKEKLEEIQKSLEDEIEKLNEMKDEEGFEKKILPLIKKLEIENAIKTNSIEDIEDEMYKLEDEIRDKFDDELADIDTKLYMLTSQYKEDLIKNIKSCEENDIKFKAYKQKLHKLKETNKLLPVMEIAEKTSNFDEGQWQQMQTQANEQFLIIKAAYWEIAHKENPFASMLTTESVKENYKEEFRFKNNQIIAKNRVRELEKIISTQDSQQLSALILKIKTNNEKLEENLKIMDQLVGTEKTEEILGQMDQLLVINNELVKYNQMAKEKIEKSQ